MPRDGANDTSLTDGILPLRADGLIFAARGTTLLGPLDLAFETGARSLVLGANGAGKSLLLRLCHGLIPPTAGRVSWNGASAASAGTRQAMVFQRPVLLRRSARANVIYALALRKAPRAKRKKIADAALARAGLGA
ncbi:MAG: ATP-binding cassette domain-containing protein, partial [Kiloniellales bacterium]